MISKRYRTLSLGQNKNSCISVSRPTLHYRLHPTFCLCFLETFYLKRNTNKSKHLYFSIKNKFKITSQPTYPIFFLQMIPEHNSLFILALFISHLCLYNCNNDYVSISIFIICNIAASDSDEGP